VRTQVPLSGIVLSITIGDTSSAQASPSPAMPSGRELLVALGYVKHPVGQSWLGFLTELSTCCHGSFSEMLDRR
jgi:hypothetical protein